MTKIATLTETICNYLDQQYCFLVGRGTTALYIALKVIESQVGRGEIILPTISCTSLAQMVLYAGFMPVFADIDPREFTIDIGSFQSKISKETKGVLPVHIFGYVAPMVDICHIAKEHEIFVIEDIAQSLGGSCNGQKMGSYGDFSILSFGGDKILSAGGGGAIVTDDGDLAAIIAEEIRKLRYPVFLVR
jgi:perosamine synthetase